MSRYLSGLMAVVALSLLLAGSAFADRLILIPTGDTLTTGGFKAEYDSRFDSDGKAYFANVGISKFEIEGARFEDFGLDDPTCVSAQLGILPDTSFTPAVAVGVRDIGDESADTGALYDGRSYYLALSKSIPATGGIPLIFQNVKLHGGVGTGGTLNGIFFGVEGTLPMGLRISGEYDSHDFNYALAYNIVPTLQAKVADIKGDMYYGVDFGVKF